MPGTVGLQECPEGSDDNPSSCSHHWIYEINGTTADSADLSLDLDWYR